MNRVKHFLLLSIVTAVLAGCTNEPSSLSLPEAASPVAATAAADAATTSITPVVTMFADPTEASSPTPSAPPPATATPEPTAIPTPAAPIFTQMTSGGCCVQPIFSPDGSQILYLDKPAPDAPVGWWAVPIAQPLAAPTLFTQRLGPFNRDFSLNAFLEGRRTIVERTSDGTQWAIDNGGRRVLFSPDGQHIAWVVSEEVGNFDVRRSDIWLANLDGQNARRVATLYGGGVQAWFSDSARMLVTGKTNRSDALPSLSILSLTDGSLTRIIDVERSRSMLLSPDDQRIIYYVGQASDPANDGLYLLDSSAGSAATPQRLNFFGAYRWCSPTRLFYIPLQAGSPSNELWVLDVTTGETHSLISAAADSPFKIGNGDWDIAPNGQHIVYLNARDRNIWLVTLPEAC